jgi:hypothetical protein
MLGTMALWMCGLLMGCSRAAPPTEVQARKIATVDPSHGRWSIGMLGDRAFVLTGRHLLVFDAQGKNATDQEGIHSVAESLPDGRVLVSGTKGTHILAPNGSTTEVPGGPHQGAVSGPGGFLLVGERTVERVDMNGKVVGRLPISAHPFPSCLAMDRSDLVAFSTFPAGTLSMWTPHETKAFEVKTGPCAFNGSGDLISSQGTKLVRIDVETGVVSAETEVGMARDVHLANQAIWVATREGGLRRFHPKTLEPLDAPALPDGKIVMGPGPDGHLMVVDATGQIWEMW